MVDNSYSAVIRMSFLSGNNVLQFSLYKACTSFLIFIFKYQFIPSDAIIRGIFLICFWIAFCLDTEINDFCMEIMYSETFLNSLIALTVVCVWISQNVLYTYTSQNEDSFRSPLFIFLAQLPLLEPLVQYLIGVAEINIFVLCLILGKQLLVFHR